MAAGSFVGGFFAARASRGSTIVEPAIGAILVVVTLLGISFGSHALEVLQGSPVAARVVGEVTGALVVGALAGAFLSEKLLGDATLSMVPWFLYSAFATFGASLIATLIAVMLFFKGDLESSSQDKLGGMLLGGIAIGCLLAGLAIGASARIRVIFASLVGGGVGVAGFALLATSQTAGGRDKDAMAGMAIMAVGGAIVTVIGSALGWTFIGKRAAD
jgi:hypothetical protein